jgi:hypothetical protein
MADMTKSDRKVKARPKHIIVIVLALQLSPEADKGEKGLQVGLVFELIADHCRYKQ